MASVVESQLLKLNGLFAVRKPTGITSAHVIRKLKSNLFKESGERFQSGPKSKFKIGHGGTLDKHASGVLVIGIGNGTKQLTTYLKGNKRYLGCGCLGIATETYDSYGQVTEDGSFDHVTQDKLEDVLKLFVGNIMQVPPIYSALKVDGQMMSRLASRGLPVKAKPARPVHIHSIQCIGFDPPQFTLDVHCGGGVYIRSLMHDIGKALNSCAYMSSLVRTQQGPFILSKHALPEDEWTLQNIKQSLEQWHNMSIVDR
ncbi:pseudouridylate synthase TRUB1-like [Glandiceps talaboti]